MSTYFVPGPKHTKTPALWNPQSMDDKPPAPYTEKAPRQWAVPLLQPRGQLRAMDRGRSIRLSPQGAASRTAGRRLS